MAIFRISFFVFLKLKSVYRYKLDLHTHFLFLDFFLIYGALNIFILKNLKLEIIEFELSCYQL